jgi:hypothetical protein
MYLREGYFEAIGPYMADDIGQGYLTITAPADEISQEILDAAEQYPDLLKEFKPDSILLAELDSELLSETFRLYRNDEVAFDASAMWAIWDTGSTLRSAGPASLPLLRTPDRASPQS